MIIDFDKINILDKDKERIQNQFIYDLVRNNRLKRSKKQNGHHQDLSDFKPDSPVGTSVGDSAFAYFPISEVLKWLKDLKVIENVPDNMSNLTLKISFGSYYEENDKIDKDGHPEPNRNEGGRKYQKIDDKWLVHPNLEKVYLYNEKYLGQQTAILTLHNKGKTHKIEKSLNKILIATGNKGDEENSLDVAKLCPPDCNE